MDKPAKTIFGIDLGTTYSCIARVDEFGQPVVIKNMEQQSTTPSVVFVESTSNIVVGDIAKESQPLNPTRVSALFKRVMGEEGWNFPVDDLKLRPQELSKFVLEKLAKDAETETGIKVEDVVITCPAYFGIAQKEATRQAGVLAGLNVRAVIFEPVAAAIAYGLRGGPDETVMVYDLGGGTFDVTIIDIKKTELTVLTTGGDARLGGSDWDVELARFMAGKLANEAGVSVDTLTADPEFYQKLLLDAEKVKQKLSRLEKTKHSDICGSDKVTIEVTRDEFDQVTHTLLERTITLTKETLENAARNDHPRPTRMCLVGGSSIMPQVKRRLDQEFPDMEIQLEDPNQIVAKGAAQFGFITVIKDEVIAIIEKTTGRKVDDLANAKPAEVAKASEQVAMQFGLAPAAVKDSVTKKITTVTSRGFGVRVHVQSLNAFRVFCLVHVDEQLPAGKTEPIATMEDQQENVEIVIFETEQRTDGKSPFIEESSCVQLVQDLLKLDRPYPKDELIDITFGLTEDGTLKVAATHKASGRHLPLEVKVSGVMTKEEIEESKQKTAGLSVA